MATRTTTNAVRDTIEVPAGADLTTVIRRANAVTDRVAANDVNNLVGTALLLEIETLLAAHYWSLFDPQYVEKKTGNASAVFNKRDWWKEAEQLDATGTLVAMAAGNQRTSLTWLGTPVSQQTDYWNRNN